MFFDGNDFDFGIPMIPEEIKNDYSKDYNKEVKLLNSKEGFLRGNMFANLYDPYKELTYLPLNPTNEREELLYKIMENDFAINDLNLYLDLHPEDDKMYEKFKMYTNECIELKDKYSKIYGPLTLEQTNSKNYKWEENPWPWDNTGGSKYV